MLCLRMVFMFLRLKAAPRRHQAVQILLAFKMKRLAESKHSPLKLHMTVQIDGRLTLSKQHLQSIVEQSLHIELQHYRHVESILCRDRDGGIQQGMACMLTIDPDLRFSPFYLHAKRIGIVKLND